MTEQFYAIPKILNIIKTSFRKVADWKPVTNNFPTAIFPSHLSPYFFLPNNVILPTSHAV